MPPIALQIRVLFGEHPESPADVVETLEEVKKLNREALAQDLDIDELIPVIEKAGRMAKTERDIKAVEETLNELPFENKFEY